MHIESGAFLAMNRVAVHGSCLGCLLHLPQRGDFALQTRGVAHAGATRATFGAELLLSDQFMATLPANGSLMYLFRRTDTGSACVRQLRGLRLIGALDGQGFLPRQFGIAGEY